MMYCKYCGKEIEEDVTFCPYCGKNLQDKASAEPQPLEEFVEASASEQAVTSAPAAPAQAEEKKPPKVWTVFSRIGRVLGIVCFATSFIPIWNIISIELGIVGIVFSCLGRKAKTEETDKLCSTGLKFSIAAVAVSVVVLILFYALYFGVIIGAAVRGPYYYG